MVPRLVFNLRRVVDTWHPSTGIPSETRCWHRLVFYLRRVVGTGISVFGEFSYPQDKIEKRQYDTYKGLFWEKNSLNMWNRSHCEDFFEIAVFRHYVVADRQNITRFLNLCTFLSDLWLKLATSSCRLSPTHLPNKFWEKTLLVVAGWVDLLEYLVIVYSSSPGLFWL